MAITVSMLDGNPVSFAEFSFLNYLFWSIRWLEWDLENEQRIAQNQITQLLARKSADHLYHWVIYCNTRDYLAIPIGSPHTPPDSSEIANSTTTSQSWPLPVPPPLQKTPPIHIWTFPTVTEAKWWQSWKDFLAEEFLKTQLKEAKKILFLLILVTLKVNSAN